MCYIKGVPKPEHRRGFKELTGTQWSKIIRSAKSRNININFNIEDAYLLMTRQNFTCPYTGTSLNFGEYGTKKEYTWNCSLDRINSDGHYTIDNCEWIWTPLNMIKGKLTRQDFIHLSYLVINPLPKQYGSVDTIGIGKALKQIRKNAKSRTREFKLSLEYIENLYKKQAGQCNLTGLQLKLPKRRREGSKQYDLPYTASLDRIDNNIGYVEGNVQWLHGDINKMKRSYTQNQFIEICNKITLYSSSGVI